MQGSPYKALLSLVQFDQETNALRAYVQELNREIVALHAAKAAYAHEQSTAHHTAHETRKQVDAYELEMKTLEEQCVHKQKQLERVTSAREQTALRKEIELLRYRQNDIEQELIALWNTADTRKRALDIRSKEIQEKSITLDNAIREKEEAIKKTEADIKEREGTWATQAQGLPDDLLQKYSLMRTAVQDPVVPVEHDACTVCFNSLTRQEMLMLRKQQLVLCKGCYRLLYSV